MALLGGKGAEVTVGLMPWSRRGNGFDRKRRDTSPEVFVLLLMLCKPRIYWIVDIFGDDMPQLVCESILQRYVNHVILAPRGFVQTALLGGRCGRHSRAYGCSRRGKWYR